MTPELLYPILHQNCLTAQAAGWTFVEGFGSVTNKTCCAVTANYLPYRDGRHDGLIELMMQNYELTYSQLYSIMWGFDGQPVCENTNQAFHSLGQRLREEFPPIK